MRFSFRAWQVEETAIFQDHPLAAGTSHPMPASPSSWANGHGRQAAVIITGCRLAVGS
jgi:hypothetical protein